MEKKGFSDTLDVKHFKCPMLRFTNLGKKKLNNLIKNIVKIGKKFKLKVNPSLNFQVSISGAGSVTDGRFAELAIVTFEYQGILPDYDLITSFKNEIMKLNKDIIVRDGLGFEYILDKGISMYNIALEFFPKEQKEVEEHKMKIRKQEFDGNVQAMINKDKILNCGCN